MASNVRPGHETSRDFWAYHILTEIFYDQDLHLCAVARAELVLLFGAWQLSCEV